MIGEFSMINRIENRYFRIIILITPLILATLVAIYGEEISSLSKYLPACLFYDLYNLYCPACGITRSIGALLEGDFLLSLRYHIAPILLLAFGILAYIELFCFFLGNKIRLIPRKAKFYQGLMTFFLLYLILRNIFPLF